MKKPKETTCPKCNGIIYIQPTVAEDYIRLKCLNTITEKKKDTTAFKPCGYLEFRKVVA